MINSFKDWKENCQRDYDYLAIIPRRELSEEGKTRLRMYRAFLNIADWSNSAAEVIEWIDGKYEMDPEIRAAIDTPMAERLIADIRQLVKEERLGKKSLPKAGIYIPGMEIPKKQVCIILNPNGLVEVLDANNVLLEEYQFIPVPSHGDLIDRGALERHTVTEWFCGNKRVTVPWKAVADAPTIIPADKLFGKSEQLADGEETE